MNTVWVNFVDYRDCIPDWIIDYRSRRCIACSELQRCQGVVLVL